jgi:hypothetical protein
MRIRDGKNSDPEWKKAGSGINIPDPQNCVQLRKDRIKCPIMQCWRSYRRFADADPTF